MHAARAVRFEDLLSARPLSIEDAKDRVSALTSRHVEVSVPQLCGDPVMWPDEWSRCIGTGSSLPRKALVA